MTIPTAEQQIEFLQQIQRLFDEGDFQATYKFALLLTLAELAVERGDDSGDELNLPMPNVAEKFAELYWRQIAPYHSGAPGSTAGVLFQNLGSQAAVVNHLDEVHRDCAGNYSRARFHPRWKEAVRSISAVIRNMPLRYLQNIGGVLVPFLYDYPAPPGLVRLKAGVAFNLRRYQALIQHLARSGWLDHVRGNCRNASMLGQLDDLESFMFASRRANLAAVVPVLHEVQAGRCFYCDDKILNGAEVDHFIPWSRYPRDTAHNFVLAHKTCNTDKRDMLAAKPHLERWMDRMVRHGGEIGERLAEHGFLADVPCSTMVARWAYEQSIAVKGHAWAGRGVVVPIGNDYLDIFIWRAQ